MAASPNNPSSLLQRSICKSSFTSLFLSTFSSISVSTANKKKNSSFRGLGCTASASQQVSVPATVGPSPIEKTVKQKMNSNKKKGNTVHKQPQFRNLGEALKANHDPSTICASDGLWCGPNDGAADSSAPVDCVVTRRNLNLVSSRHKFHQRFYAARRGAHLEEHISVPDLDSAFGSANSETDVGSRYCRHVRHRSPEAFAEILMLQSDLLMGGRLASRDQFRDWRLNIDGMTYEELLALGDQIGYVSTGLKEHELSRYLRKITGNLSSNFSREKESKCSICQEEYEIDDEMGKLNCGHTYHMDCIKHWLLQKNACPVCKCEVVARR